MKHEYTDVLIIGCGPAGSVAAAYLHKKGLRVNIIEKQKFPRFSIGESLLPKSMEHFVEADLFDCINKAGFEKKYGARFIKGDEVCHFDFSEKHGLGWDWTWQVPRADFDQVIAEELIGKGVDIRFESSIDRVDFSGTESITRVVHPKNGIYEISAKFIIDASGNARVLANFLGLEHDKKPTNFSSIFTHVKDIKRPGNKGNLISFEIIEQNVWLWVIPFSNGNTSLGIVGPTEFIESFGKSASKGLAQMLGLSKFFHQRFKDAEFLFQPHMAKNYTHSIQDVVGQGYVLTGNSRGFIDPIFSSGVAFATESAIKAAKLIYLQLNGKEVNWDFDYVQHMDKGLSVFETYVKEWYNGNLQKLFFHKPAQPTVKRQICAVLAGYVWDESNPFTKRHQRLIPNLAYLTDVAKKSL